LGQATFPWGKALPGSGSEGNQDSGAAGPGARMKGEGRRNGRVRTHGGVCICVGEYMRGDALICVCAHVCGCQRHCGRGTRSCPGSREQQVREATWPTGLLSGVDELRCVPEGPQCRCAWGVGAVVCAIEDGR
jgi:hypothetical protein